MTEKKIPEDFAERQRLFEQHRDTIIGRELSNSEHFDKALLTYSASGLALSLSILKDIRPPAALESVYLLQSSWIFFVCTMILTIASYPVSQIGLRKQMLLAERYYLKYDEAAFTEKNPCGSAVERIGIVAGTLFICAVIFTTIFVTINMGASK